MKRRIFKGRQLILQQVAEDFFPAPNVPYVLIHTTNTVGSWSLGLARLIKRKFPAAFHYYSQACSDDLHEANPLLGTCYLISPPGSRDPRWNGVTPRPRQWIACLFVTHRGGTNNHDSPESITKYTKRAMRDLMAQLRHKERDYEDDSDERRRDVLANLRMAQINTAVYGVDWAKTEEQLQGMRLYDEPEYEGLGSGNTYINLIALPDSDSDH